MGTVDAFERDMGRQPALLESFRPPPCIPGDQLRGALFAGSGDSLASAMLAESLSGGLARAADPAEAASGPRAPGDLYVVSVSGGTSAGVRAARRARSCTAVTARPDSPLARASGRVILLESDFDSRTAGSVSFLEGALVCASLVSGGRLPRDGRLYEQAGEDAAGVRLPGRLYILGSGATYPLAMYCAAKLYEMTGHDARYCRTEQFFHMELFSAREGDGVLLLEPDSPRARRLEGEVAGAGLEPVRPPVPGGSIEGALYCAFLAQFLALGEARRQGRRDCHYVTAAGLRGASNAVIY